MPSDAPAVSRHPSGDKVNQQPPLNAANPFSCSSPGASFERLTGLPRSLPEPNPSDQFDATLSFREWAAALPRWILKSRSPFGLLFSFSCQPVGSCPTFRDFSAAPSLLGTVFWQRPTALKGFLAPPASSEGLAHLGSCPELCARGPSRYPF